MNILRQDLRLESSGGITKVLTIPQQAQHGDIIVHLVDGVIPTLKQYNDITKTWVEIGGSGIPKGEELPIVGLHGDLFNLVTKGEVPKLFQYNEVEKIWNEVGGGVNGGVFITDITPINSGDNVGNKIYEDVENVQLREVTTTASAVRVKVLAITGHTHYKPVVTIGENIVQLSPLSDKPLFEGFLNVVIVDEKITATHEDGASHTVLIRKESPPKIESLKFVGEYQGIQTELKENDIHKIEIKTDVPIVKAEMADFGAFKSRVINISGTILTVDGIVANRGNTPQLLPARVRVQRSSGSWSEWYTTNTTGNVEKVNVIKLNNLKPTINITQIIYPANQQALKDNELAKVVNTITNYDSVQYTSPNSQLNISNTATFENEKNVTRLSGAYNVSVNNFTITAKRNANDSTNVISTIVFIAHEFQVVTISNQFSRFQSSQAGEEYWMKLISNQRLIETPTLQIPNGTWVGSFTTTNNTEWTRYIKVYDSDTKGAFSYFGLVTKNLAGRTVNVISGNDTYTLGGFKTKRIFFAPYSPISNLNVIVTDFTKLNAVDTNGYVMTYQSDKSNKVQGFTITDSNGNLQAPYTHVFNCWADAVIANATGNYYFDISEGV